MIAIYVELADDLRGNVILAPPLPVEHKPERVRADGGGSVRRQLLQNADCIGDGLDGDPFGWLAAALLPL
jgi:hypothetical protein